MAKKNKKELPISTDSRIRTYTYYAYSLSIIDNDYRTGELAADIDLSDYKNHTWENSFDDLRMEEEGENLLFYAKNPYNKNMNGCMVRNANQKDEIRIKVNYQQFTQPWSFIGIFLAKREDISQKGGSYLCKLGNFCRSGIFYRVDAKDVKIDKSLCTGAKELILRRDGREVKAFIKNGNNKTCLLHANRIDVKEEDELSLGVQIQLNDNNFYHWLFTNFIQIDCDVKDQNLKVKYHYGFRKNWNHYSVNHFLDYSEMDWDVIPVKQSERIQYIKQCVDRDYYIELWMNQFFVEGRDEYNSYHFFHQNLVYGYDDTRKCLLILGIDNNGYLERTKISYGNFLRNENFTDMHRKINLIRYNQDGNLYYFDVGYVKEMIRQYLDGTNSGMYLQFLVQREDRTYGMDIYEEWLKEEWLPHFVSDVRILHLLHEHKLCMKERIQFLYYNRYVDDNTYGALIPYMDEVILLAEGLKLMALKSSAFGKDLNKEEFHKILMELREKEKACYQCLLSFGE